jgi:hypothetical protein
MRERARGKGRLLDIIEYSDNVTMLIEGYDLQKLAYSAHLTLGKSSSIFRPIGNRYI